MSKYGTINATWKMEGADELQEAFDVLARNLTSLDKNAEQFIKRMVEQGVEYAKDRAPIDTGDLREGIYGTCKGAEGIIYSTSDHAAFVEFGTGVVGDGTYPGDNQGYAYNVPSEYKDETGGWWWNGNYTHGYPANPYMFDTMQYLKSIAVKTAKETMKVGKRKRNIQPNKE